MRLIPGKTKVKIELFRGITLGDIIVGVITLALVALVVLSTLPGRMYIAVGVIAVGAMLIFRMDEQPNYITVLHILRYIAYPKNYWRTFSDKHLLTKNQEKKVGEQWNEYFDEKLENSELLSLSERLEKIKTEREKKEQEDAVLNDKNAADEEKNAIWKERQKRDSEIKTIKKETKENLKKFKNIEEMIPFTGISDGFIEYNGKYYGTIIEVDSVEFRFFSQYRRNNSIEDCFGKILRSLRENYAANIIKIDRPIIYTDYLDKEYDKLDALRASYEKGLLTEAELQSRVEIQYDRIHAMREICFEEKVIQPFYYIAIFNIDKRQLIIDTEQALTALTQAELKVRRLAEDKELAVFLKYTNYLDFDESEVEELAPVDYAAWAMPENLSFTSKRATVNNIVTHNLRVVGYPFEVGDAWLAGVMSIPATKVVVKVTPMERTRSIRAIDRSLQELRGQYNATGIDSKKLEIEKHIETLSSLLVTLQQENESLLNVNIYITMYDAIKTSEFGSSEAVKDTSLPTIADMKKTVRRSWHETGMRLNAMDFAQHEAFIGAQVSGYDPMLSDGRGMPSNTIAATFPWIYSRVSDAGGIRLGSQDGVPVFIDFFRRDSERINSNMVIIGKSGSGKSYGTKSLLTNMASEDAKIFILDPENEYTELAHNLHGKVINVGNAKYGRLNPFHIITTLDDDENGVQANGNSFAAHLQFLEEFFKQILPDIDKDALEYLNSLVERLYLNFDITAETDLSKLSPKDYPIFDDLYDVVLEVFQRTNNEYLRNMLQTLMNYISKFSTGGRNASIWNGPSSITTDENFSVFNFQSLLANRNTTIANAQMLLVLKYIDNEIIKNRDYNKKFGLNRKIIVVIDEAHVFIDTKFPIALDFMFQLAKRIRKYNGMQIVITQNIKGFVGSEEIARKSTAIINACQYSFIFGLAPNDMDDLCKLYEKAGGINEVEQEQIVTAPRGMAFTVMSPTSRSSFMIEVPQSMVDMFEQPDHVSSYFAGEEGAKNWEDFVAESRAAHDQHSTDRLIQKIDEHIADLKKGSGISFSEISAEEAEKYASNEDSVKFSENIGSERTGSVSFEEIHEPHELEEIPESIRETVPAEKPALPTEPSKPMNTPFDMDTLLAAVRAEVRAEVMREVGEQMKIAGVSIGGVKATEETIPESRPAASEEPMPESRPAAVEEPVPAKEAESFNSSSLFDDNEPDEEDTASSQSDHKVPKFDIMALLDEQLDHYSEMGLIERMDEIGYMTMEITLEELAAYIKESRKRR